MSAKISDLEFLSWQEGIDRIDNALGSLGIRSLSEDSAPVITSKDPIAKRMKETLSIKGLPDGFSKWQLPVYFEGEGAQFFITVAEPGVEADEHAHSNGAAMRFIVSGSIEYAGTELTQGDWMFIPKDTSYSFKAGDMGAVMCYCYPCCCVPK
ncbi:MAG: cupin domain-containing protein [Gammaproteobacteria bacterium]|nr:cupin domain-containing protein [Gammaproteobacteria bacterium]